LPERLDWRHYCGILLLIISLIFKNMIDLNTQYLTIIAVIVALSGNILIVILWYRDRQSEKEIDKRVLRLLAKELKTNLSISEAIARKEFRKFEDKVFYSTLNSHRLVRFLGDNDKLIHTLFECYHTASVLNEMIEEALIRRRLATIDKDYHYNDKEAFPAFLAEEQNFLEELIGELEQISKE